MNNSKTATQKHMTLDDRISIEKGLDQHLSLRSIALQLGKNLSLRGLYSSILPLQFAG